MKTTSIYFSDKGLVKETRTVQVNNDTNYDPDFDERPKPERGDIAFEPPFDDEEVRPTKGNIKLEDPVDPTIEDRLEQLEKGQDQIKMMLQTLLNITSKDIE